ncbi:MAG: energy transducer TonB family protein [Myxococcota bacterium]
MEHSTDIAAQQGLEAPFDACALSSFQPHDERTLWRGLSISGIVHGMIATALIVYGVELVGLDQRAVAPAFVAAPPIQASFVFQKREEPELKPHLVPEKIAEAITPEPAKIPTPHQVLRKPKPKLKKARVAKTAPRAKKPRTAPRPAEERPTVIAPGVADTAADTSAAPPPENLAAASGPATTSAPPTPSGGVQSTVDRAGLLKAYVKSLSKAVRKRRAYPRAAKLAGLEGRAVVRIVLNETGSIVAIELASSSGHDILDRAALEAARSVGALPAAPSGLNWGTRAIKVPFSFKVAS